MNVYIQQRKSLRRAIAVECRVLRQRDNAIVGTTVPSTFPSKACLCQPGAR